MEINDENYHKHYAFGSGDVHNWLKGYRFFLDGRASGSTRPMVRGSLAHCLLLEPESFDERYVVCPLKSVNSKAFDKMVEGNPGREVVLEKEVDEARLWVAPFNNSPALINAEKEKICICDHEGLSLKGKFDASNENVIFDFKTCASIHGFQHSAAQYGYHMQSYHYKLLYSRVYDIPLEELKFYFLLTEKSTHHSKIVEFDEQANEVAKEQHDLAIKNARAVMKSRGLTQEELLNIKPEAVAAYDRRKVTTLSLPRGYMFEHYNKMEIDDNE